MSATKEFHHDKIEQGMRESQAKKRDYPVLFDTEMVKAILSGEKTQTRRVVKPQPRLHDENNWPWKMTEKEGPVPYDCPYGEVGENLWVKETTIFNKNSKSYWPVSLGYLKTSDYEKKVPSIHMPKSEARLWLEITDIKAHRIQSISEEDAREEGCGVAKIYGFSESDQPNFREGFFAKWIAIYGIESYYENPWLWAIKFKVL